jgi:hypothetical protein
MLSKDIFSKAEAQWCSCLWSIAVRYGMDLFDVDSGSAGC